MPNTDLFGRPAPDSIWLGMQRLENFAVNGRLDYSFNQNHNAFLHAYYFNYINFTFLLPGMSANPTYSITNLELQDNLTIPLADFGSLDLLYGGNGRVISFDIKTLGGEQVFAEPRSTKYIVAGFLQDKLSLGKYLSLTTGAKAETWTLVGNTPEISPTARLAIMPSERATLWGAWSRSVTTPGYIQSGVEARQAQLPGPTSLAWRSPETWASLGLPMDTVPPAGAGKWVALVPNDSVKTAKYYTTEGGVRAIPIKDLYLDLSTYYAQFRDGYQLTTADPRVVIPSKIHPGDSIVPIYYKNLLRGHGYGLELVARYKPVAFSQVEVSYAWSRWLDDSQGKDLGDKMPNHIIRTRIYLDLPFETSLYLGGQWRSRIEKAIDKYDFNTQEHDPAAESGIGADAAPATFKADFCIEKKFLNDKLSVNVWGNDILHGPYVETYAWYVDVYPHTIQGTFGAGISYRF
jgi:hypothetical protein